MALKIALVILCPSYVKYINLSDDSLRGWLGESWHSGHGGATSPHPALFCGRRVDGWLSLRCRIKTGATACVGSLHDNNNSSSSIIIEPCSFFFNTCHTLGRAASPCQWKLSVLLILLFHSSLNQLKLAVRTPPQPLHPVLSPTISLKVQLSSLITPQAEDLV